MNLVAKKIVCILTACIFCIVFTPVICCATVITFDDIPSGLIGNQYLSKGVKFFTGNNKQGSSTGLLMSGGSPVSASVGNFGTSITLPHVMIATGGVNDIIVHFFDGNGQRTFASSVGIFNDTQGSPSRIFLEGFDFVGQSLGRTQIDGASSGGTFSASGIYFAKIYGAPGYPLDLGVDNFSFTLGSTAVPEPTSIIVFGTGIVGLIGFRRCPKRVR